MFSGIYKILCVHRFHDRRNEQARNDVWVASWKHYKRVFGSRPFSATQAICMVAERGHRSARQCFNTRADSPLRSSSEAMAFRGTTNAVAADAAMRALSIGVVSVSVAGEAATQVARASGWCDRRKASRPPSRGRQGVDIIGATITAKEQMSIHSTTPIRNIDNTELVQQFIAEFD